jgi:FhaA, N-terminal domain/FHA domain
MAGGGCPIERHHRVPVKPMNPLKSVESMLSSLVEGAFGRVFRAEVRPMELARKLAREMDSHRTVSVSRTYVPNEYSVWLSVPDRERYEGVEQEVIDELCAYLLEHARREDLIMASPPRIFFHTDERLSLGEFGIQARLVRAQEDEQAEYERAPDGASSGETIVYSEAERVLEERSPPPPQAARALLAVAGRRLIVPPDGGTLGRSRECDIVLDDAGVSRKHAELRRGTQGWTLADLGSTNGVRVNGRELREPCVLRPGDRIELGSTEAVFEVT